jgi:hypothetical protein
MTSTLPSSVVTRALRASTGTYSAVITVPFRFVSDEALQVSVGAPVEPDFLRPVYANQLNMTFTPHDFKLTFSYLALPNEPPVPGPDGTVQIRPTAVASVVIPATLMHALMSVFNTQFDKYLQQFGPPGMDPTGPGGQQ